MEEESAALGRVHTTGVHLALMSGVLSTDAILLSIPSVGKRVFAPHVGTVLSRYYPGLQLPRIYRKKSQTEQKQKIGSITENMRRSESFYDPGLYKKCLVSCLIKISASSARINQIHGFSVILLLNLN